MKALQKYSGPVEELSPPEQFLLIMSSVPRLNEKIHLLMLMHQFEVRPGCTVSSTPFWQSIKSAWKSINSTLESNSRLLWLLWHSMHV